jgi:hypothetical protein
MSTIDKVRALFVPGDQVECVENTYLRARGGEEKALRRWTVGAVGKAVWRPADDAAWRGTFPTRAADVLHVDEQQATWKIRGDYSVTYRRV